MKLFGWGRKKEPPPTCHDEPVKQSGYGVSTARNNCNSGSTTGWRSRDLKLQDWLPKGHDYERETAPPRSEAPAEVAWEDRLQETIRFVFSHEKEGLLAIGTFALDDLAGARFGLDVIAEPLRKSDPRLCTSRVDSDVDSDDAALTEFCQQQQQTKRKELPVFGDHDALIDLQPVVGSNVQVLPIQVLKPTSGADTEVVVTNDQKLTSSVQQEKRDLEEKQLYVSSGVVGSATTVEHDDDEDLVAYSPALCGLFPSRSRRSEAKLIEKEKRRKKVLVLESEASNDVKKSVKSKGLRTSLARLWRSGCHGSPATAEVSPEPQLLRSDSSQSQGSTGVPCIANVEPPELPKLVTLLKALPKQANQAAAAAGEPGGERKRRTGHCFGKASWACAHNGKWIRTDSELTGDGVGFMQLSSWKCESMTAKKSMAQGSSSRHAPAHDGTHISNVVFTTTDSHWLTLNTYTLHK